MLSTRIARVHASRGRVTAELVLGNWQGHCTRPGIRALLCAAQPALAQFTQQGPKLVGTGAVGTPTKASRSRCPPTATPRSWAGMTTTRSPERRGSSPAAAGYGASRARSSSAPALSEPPTRLSVALSADGNTAIVGGYGDNGGRSGVGLHPKRRRLDPAGTKLVGTGAVGGAQQGIRSRCRPMATPRLWAGSRQLGIGAAWVFTRSSGVWTQQGTKLVGTGAVGAAHQGFSVALSADGNTAIVGGTRQRGRGAAWVFTRSGGVWTQQGPSWSAPALSEPHQGYSVALSADGNTAIVGGAADNATLARRGSSPAAAASGPSRAQAGRHRRCRNRPKALGRAVRRRQHRYGGRENDNATPERRGSSPAAAASGPSKAKLVGTGAVGAADQGYLGRALRRRHHRDRGRAIDNGGSVPRGSFGPNQSDRDARLQRRR